MDSLGGGRSAVGRVVAVILGAGQGVRLNGGAINKVLLPLGGEPLITRAARVFSTHTAVDELLVVAAANEVGVCTSVFRRAGVSVSALVPGGPSRHASEWRAISHVAQRIERGDVDVVLIHDAARPLYQGQRLEELLDVARETGGAIFAVPVDPQEDLVRIDGKPLAPAPTDGMWRSQTPQAFRASLLLEAFRRAEEEGFEGTDTASTVERVGVDIRVVPGDPYNIKITYPEDFVLAESLLDGRRR
jgi:2-C-methyl-D-erythritol 4-phosphate cytidylyltransferase